MTESNLVAFYKRAIARRGRDVKFRRVVPGSPEAQVTDVVVRAIVTRMAPDTIASIRQGRSEREVGGLRNFDRQVIVMADDLAGQGFPLPVQTDDALFLDPDTNKRKLAISQVDPETRALAGAIELLATGT